MVAPRGELDVGAVQPHRYSRKMTAAEVIRAAMELPPEGRARVVDVLLEADEGTPSTVDSAWRSEVTRRIGEIRDGNARGMTLDEVTAFLEERRAARRS